jgi:ATP-dependent exoDNAse (exonuclease V) beta subunit
MSDESIRTLCVVRRGYSSSREFVGYVATFPSQQLPVDEAPTAPVAFDDAGALGDLLQWTSPVPPGARIDAIRPVGIVAPSRWECLYLRWLSATLSAPLVDGWQAWPNPGGASGPAAAAANLETSHGRFWSSPTDVPEGVRIVRTETRRGEARHAAATIRSWLHRNHASGAWAEACDDVLVLLPPDPSLVSVWLDVFDAHDLPVRALTFRPLTRDPFVQWVLDLAHLAGWSDANSRPRALLQRVLLSRFWSGKAVQEWLALEQGTSLSRTVLAKLLRTLRRPAVTLSEWRRHLQAPGSGQDAPADLLTPQAIGRMTDALAAALDPSRLGASLTSLLVVRKGDRHPSFHLGVRDALMFLHNKQKAADDEWAATDAAVLHARVLSALSALQNDQEPAGAFATGGQLDAARDRQLAGLQERLDAQFLADRRDPVHGVTFSPYALYDHRSTGLLIMAGLGEGQFPSVAPLPSERETGWLRALGLLVGPETPADWIVRDVEDQIELARAALLQAEEAVLGFSTEGTGTGELHPGPLLSLLAGSWEEKTWLAGGERLSVLAAGLDIPALPDKVTNWTEARLFAAYPTARASLATVVAGDEAATEKAAALDALDLSLQASRRADLERRPEKEGRPGPYTGRLHGATLPITLGDGEHAPRYSPTSLEQFGECPYKYFLGKVLRLKPVEDAGDDLDALETGTTIHSVFASAARKVIAGKAGAVWDLTFDAGSSDEERKHNRAKKAEEVLAILLPGVAEAMDEAATSQPTLCRPLIEQVSGRWCQALRNWVEKHVQERIPAEVDDAAIDQTPSVLAAQKELEQVRAKCLSDMDILAEFAEQVRSGIFNTDNDKDATLWAKRIQARPDGGPKGIVGWLKAFRARLKSEGVGALESALESLRNTWLSTEMAKPENALVQARTTEKARRENAGAARRVAFAELSFGRDESDETADPHSLPEPWEAACSDGRLVHVTGQVDRVDWDAERSCLAVRDYKSGKSKGAKKLASEMRLGFHLQLMLYACAMEELLANNGRIPELAGCCVRDLSLEFPKDAKQAALDFSSPVDVASPPAETDGAAAPAQPAQAESTTWRDIALQWLGYNTAGIEAGRFDLIPQRCPLASSDAYCDFSRICRCSAEHMGNYEASIDRPAFPAPTEEPKSKKSTPLQTIAPSLPPDTSDPTRDRRLHAEGQALAADLSRDVIVSAGAGTGKTWNLVRRYLAALDAGIAPEEILCVTFTRKAAAEMQQRVRAGLLQRVADHGDRALPEDLRKKILTLSAAPIWTLDSLALHLLQALHDAKSAHDSDVPAAPPTVDPSGAAAEFEQFLSDRFLRAVTEQDGEIVFLLEHVTVHCLRKELESVIRESCGVPEAVWPISPEDVLSRWQTLFRPLLERLRSAARDLDLDEWARCLEEDAARISPENVERTREAIRAARLLAGKDALADGDVLRCVKVLQEVPTAQKGRNGIGDKALYEWVKGNPVKGLRQDALGDGSMAMKAFDEWRKAADRMPLLAEIAFRTLKVCKLWGDEFQARLVQRGTLRYGDVEAVALQALKNEDDAAILKEFLPFKHIFVDESQDTSERQAKLVADLATLTGARLFWVGDPKQSIYRFRGAEVDTFEDRVAGACDAPDVGLASLRVNRRSHPLLIEAVNRLFGAMFSASKDGVALDPGSKVPFEPQTWPEMRKGEPGEPDAVPWDLEAEGPRIEWIVDPKVPSPKEPAEDAEPVQEGDNAAQDDDTDSEDLPESEEPPSAEAADAVAIRVRRLLAEAARDGAQVASGTIALLVRTWNQASAWRDVLAKHGIPCAVQGGSGLLKTPEADLLRLWLEASVRRDDVALAGILRGPGVALSDAGLYCLRAGHGVVLSADDGQSSSAKPPYRLRLAMTGRLDAAAAVDAWDKASGVGDRTETLALLAQDVQALDRFKAVWEEFGRRVDISSAANTLTWLVRRLGLDAYWAAGPGGRQAVANVTEMIDVVYEFESDQGCSPHRLLRYLDDMAGSDDPASGGLDAGLGTPVVVTTAWQAKGREWPIVILPDLDGFEIKADAAGMGLQRIVQFDLITGERGDVLYVPDVVATTEAKPFEASDKPVSALLRVYDGPAARAELRRLLYVAMTRAKERLVLVGKLKVSNPDGGSTRTVDDGNGGKFKTVTLDRARRWSELLCMCTGLAYVPKKDEVENGKSVMHLALPADGAWRSGTDVQVKTLSEVLEEGVPIDSSVAASEPVFAPGVPLLWRPVVSDALNRVTPSGVKAASTIPAPAPQGAASPTATFTIPFPFERENQSGSAFHKLMELWGFGANGQPIDLELAGQALDETDLGANGTRAARCDWLLGLAHKTEADNPALIERLRAAAAAGNLFHEAPLQFNRTDGSRVEGTVDLLWKDDAGWHLLDYKTGSDSPSGKVDEMLRHENLRKHFAQVSLYAEGLGRMLAGGLADFGVWYVPVGLVVSWATGAGTDSAEAS